MSHYIATYCFLDFLNIGEVFGSKVPCILGVTVY